MHDHLPKSPPLDRESYVRARDGTLLYYNVTGLAHAANGKAPLVLTDGVACDQYVWSYLVGHFARTRPVLRWNLRAHGRSAVPADRDAFSIEEHAADLATVLDDVGFGQAVLCGHSMGVQVTLELIRKQPERATALGLFCGAPGRLLDSFHGSDLLSLAFPAIYEGFTKLPWLFGTVWRALLPSDLSFRIASTGEINAQMLNREDFMGYLEHASRLDVDLFARMLSAARTHDASDVLPSVRVPALVVAAERDTFTPLSRGLELWRGLPDADLLVMPGCGHAAPIELPELLNLRLEKFLAERVDANGGPAA